MSVPTPEQIAESATGPRREIMYHASQMSAHECALFFSLLAASFTARELGPPPYFYERRQMIPVRNLLQPSEGEERP